MREFDEDVATFLTEWQLLPTAHQKADAAYGRKVDAGLGGPRSAHCCYLLATRWSPKPVISSGRANRARKRSFVQICGERPECALSGR